MERGAQNKVGATVNDVTLLFAAFVGAGASDATLATAAQYAAQGANLGVTCVRTSIGLFVVTISEKVPRILNIHPEILGTEGLRATTKVAYSPSAKTLTVNVWDPGGALDDPETTDTLILTILAQNSTS